MTVTITITDPTATEATALRAYLTALHATPEWVGKRIVMQADQVVFPAQHDPVVLGTETNPSPIVPIEMDEPTVDAATAGAPDFDSAGYPWDERIHAGSRATVADGTWRKKRGVSPEEVAAVEATLIQDGIKQVDAAHEAIAEATGNTDAVTVEAPDAPEQDQHIQTSPIPEVAEASVDAPPPPPAATPNPFLAVMSRIGKSKLDKAKKDELLTAAGALDEKGNPSILVLNKRPELIDGFVALLDSEGV